MKNEELLKAGFEYVRDITEPDWWEMMK